MSNSRHWLEIAEYAFLVVSVLGTAIAVVSGQIIYVALPVCGSLLLNIVNRLRFEQQTRRRATAALIRLEEEISEDILSLEEKILDQIGKSKPPILPYTPRVPETQTTVSYQMQQEIAALQTQMESCVSQLEAINIQPLNKDIALQKRLIALIQEQCASLEKSLSNVIEYLNNSSLSTKVNDLEQGLAQIVEAIAAIQKQHQQAIQPRVDKSEKVAAIPVSETQSNQAPVPLTLPSITAKVALPQVEQPQSVDQQTESPPAPPSVKQQNWRCIHTLTGHTDWVRAIAISPDGKTLASGSFDKTIKLWQLPDGQLINTLSKHSKGVFSVAIAPDGQTLASGSWDQTIKLWQMETGKLLYTLTEHSGSVRSIAIAPDGQTLISGSFDGTIKLWSPTSGQLTSTLTEEAGQLYAIALSPDGQTLASGGEDGIVTLWRLDTGKQLAVLTGNSTNVMERVSTVWSLVMSPDGQILACGSGDGTIKLWHLGNRQLLGVLHAHSGQVMCVAIDADGQTLISGSVDGTIKLWHLNTGQQIGTLTGDSSASVISVAIDPQGKTLASGNVDGIIKVWQQNDFL